MVRYLVTRLGQALIVIVLVTVITFILLHLLPGGAARATLGKEATLQQLAAFNHQMGYDRPWIQQYALYVQRLLHGDLGYSYQLNQSVTEAIGQRLPKTMVLSLLSTLLAVVVAIPLGVDPGGPPQPLARLRHHLAVAAGLRHPDLLHGPHDDHPVLAGLADPAAGGAAGVHGRGGARRPGRARPAHDHARHRDDRGLLALRALLAWSTT